MGWMDALRMAASAKKDEASAPQTAEEIYAKKAEAYDQQKQQERAQAEAMARVAAQAFSGASTGLDPYELGQGRSGLPVDAGQYLPGSEPMAMGSPSGTQSTFTPYQQKALSDEREKNKVRVEDIWPLLKAAFERR